MKVTKNALKNIDWNFFYERKRHMEKTAYIYTKISRTDRQQHTFPSNKKYWYLIDDWRLMPNKKRQFWMWIGRGFWDHVWNQRIFFEQLKEVFLCRTSGISVTTFTKILNGEIYFLLFWSNTLILVLKNFTTT